MFMNPHPVDSNHADESPDKPIHLPRPDAENITVLTRELPNEPILPWHRFDSPWLQSDLNEDSIEVDEDGVEAGDQETSDQSNEDDDTNEAVAQLSIFEDEKLDDDEEPGIEFLNSDTAR